MPGIESKLPEGWERSETTSGIPYYIDHETECTSWDHPEMVKLLQEIASLNNIKYAAYRTAMKLRAIQKRTQLFLLELPIIITTLQEEDVRDCYTEKLLTASDVQRIIMTIYINQNGDRKGFIDVPLATDLTFNWILNAFDQNRTGFVQSLSLKVGLSLMCAAKIQDKYKYIFRQLCNSKGWMDKKRLKTFLQESLQIPKNIYESAVFSGTSVEPAVRNCFERTGAVMDQLNMEGFLEWMVAEPQTVVWLPTLHRVAVSEDVKHEAKCNICKMYPIVGFRYRCLKCFNFDLCQECFWLGRTNKGHKIGHPTQEYCLAPSQKEDIKDFAKVMRNKVSKKKKPTDPSKGRYISIANEDAAPSSDEEYTVDGPPVSNATTHDKLGSYAAKLADYDEIDTKPRQGSPRSVDRDERSFNSYPRQRSSAEPSHMETSLQLHSRADFPSSLDIQQKDELENLISNLEDDNSALRDEIDHIHQLQLQNLSLDTHHTTEEAERLRQRKERLLAREEVLESHNHQLEIQLNRLRSLLHQNSPYVQSSKHVALSPTIPYQPTPLPATKNDGLYLNKQDNKGLQSSQPSVGRVNKGQPLTGGNSAQDYNGIGRYATLPDHNGIARYATSPDRSGTGGFASSLSQNGIGGYTTLHDHSGTGGFATSPSCNGIGGYTTSHDHSGTGGFATSPSRNGTVGYSTSPDYNGIGGYTTSHDHSGIGGNIALRDRNGTGGYATAPDRSGIGGNTALHDRNGTGGYATSPDRSGIGVYATSPDPSGIGGNNALHDRNGTGGYATSPDCSGIGGYVKSPDHSGIGSNNALHDRSGIGSYATSPDQNGGNTALHDCNGIGGYTASHDRTAREGYSPSHDQAGIHNHAHEHGGTNSQNRSDLQTIVDRMASSFPLTEAESDISMEMHSDLFLAASMVGEAMQSLVTAVSRQGVPSSAFPE